VNKLKKDEKKNKKAIYKNTEAYRLVVLCDIKANNNNNPFCFNTISSIGVPLLTTHVTILFLIM